MRLAPVIWPEGPGPQGQESLAQGLYVFSVGHTAPWMPQRGCRTQPRVSTLGTVKLTVRPEGARAPWNEFRVLSFVLLPRSISRPFRARRSGRLVPGLKPWAEPSSPFGAELRALRAVWQALNRYQGLPWVSRNKHIRSKGQENFGARIRP
jgi:hypothetical protein